MRTLSEKIIRSLSDQVTETIKIDYSVDESLDRSDTAITAIVLKNSQKVGYSYFKKGGACSIRMDKYEELTCEEWTKVSNNLHTNMSTLLSNANTENQNE